MTTQATHYQGPGRRATDRNQLPSRTLVITQMRHRVKRFWPQRTTRQDVIARGRKRVHHTSDKKK